MLTAAVWPTALEEVVAADHVGGTLAVVVVLVLLLLPLAVIAWIRIRAHRLEVEAALAQAIERDADEPPREGSVLVRGVVEAGSGPVVEVAIHQAGTERKHKSSWDTDWRETHREVVVVPFVLVTTGGERVRCEPDKRTRLLDALDQTERVSLRERIRRAVLTHGERVTVRGQVACMPAAGPGSGYRDGGKELVMKPGATGMEISTVGLSASLREAAKLQRSWVRALLVVLLVTQLPLTRWYVSLLGGRVEAATVVDASARRVRTKSGYRLAHSVSLALARGEKMTVDVVSTDAARLPRGTVVPVRASRLATTIGGRPSENEGAFFFSGTVLAAALALAALVLRREKPWYEQAKIVESRKGRLADDCPAHLRAGPPTATQPADTTVTP